MKGRLFTDEERLRGARKGLRSAPRHSLPGLRRIIRNLELRLACDHRHARPSDGYCGGCGSRLRNKEAS